MQLRHISPSLSTFCHLREPGRAIEHSILAHGAHNTIQYCIFEEKPTLRTTTFSVVVVVVIVVVFSHGQRQNGSVKKQSMAYTCQGRHIMSCHITPLTSAMPGTIARLLVHSFARSFIHFVHCGAVRCGAVRCSAGWHHTNQLNTQRYSSILPGALLFSFHPFDSYFENHSLLSPRPNGDQHQHVFGRRHTLAQPAQRYSRFCPSV